MPYSTKTQSSLNFLGVLYHCQLHRFELSEIVKPISVWQETAPKQTQDDAQQNKLEYRTKPINQHQIKAPVPTHVNTTSFTTKLFYNGGKVGEFTLPEPRTSSHGLLELAALGDVATTEAFCRVLVADEQTSGLLPHTSALLVEDSEQFMSSVLMLLLLANTSPRGPPIEAAQATGSQLTTFGICSVPRPALKEAKLSVNLRGESVWFSGNAEEEQENWGMHSCICPP